MSYRPDETDLRIMRATRNGLPVCARPYHRLADDLDLAVDEVMERFRRLEEAGVIRTIAALPSYFRLGLRANGISVWDVHNDRVDELGRRLGELECVTDCYRRPRRLPLWPYNLFVMVHGRTREEVMEGVARIAALLGDACRRHDVLFGSGILKKTGLRLPRSAA